MADLIDAAELEQAAGSPAWQAILEACATLELDAFEKLSTVTDTAELYRCQGEIRALRALAVTPQLMIEDARKQAAEADRKAHLELGHQRAHQRRIGGAFR